MVIGESVQLIYSIHKTVNMWQAS